MIAERFTQIAVVGEGFSISLQLKTRDTHHSQILVSPLGKAEIHGLQVSHSKGNLQFCTLGTHATAESDAVQGTFRFAEHQYDYLGEANTSISDTNTGWIDLLCWGSSGWHVEPNSLKDGDNDIESLCGNEAYADWGV